MNIRERPVRTNPKPSLHLHLDGGDPRVKAAGVTENRVRPGQGCWTGLPRPHAQARRSAPDWLVVASQGRAGSPVRVWSE